MGWRSSRPAKADEGRLTFEEFVNASAGRLLRTAVFLVHDRHLAEDLVQSTYERVARRWTRIQRAGGRPEAYARKVLVNLVIDDRKRRARRGDVLVGSVADVDHRPREKAVRRTREAAGPVPRDAPGRTVEALGWAACGRQ